MCARAATRGPAATGWATMTTMRTRKKGAEAKKRRQARRRAKLLASRATTAERLRGARQVEEGEGRGKLLHRDSSLVVHHEYVPACVIGAPADQWKEILSMFVCAIVRLAFPDSAYHGQFLDVWRLNEASDEKSCSLLPPDC